MTYLYLPIYLNVKINNVMDFIIYKYLSNNNNLLFTVNSDVGICQFL